MSLDRRSFLQGLSLGAIGAFVGCNSAVASNDIVLPAAPPAPWPRVPVPPLPVYNDAAPDAFWRAVRAQYPLLDKPVYLNTGGLGPVSQPVLDQMFAMINRSQEHSEHGHDNSEAARETMAEFLGVEAREVSFTRNATEGNSIIAGGLALKAGDEVIFESHAHPGGSFPWYNQEKNRGIKVRLFEPDAASPEGNLARIRALVTPRTKVIQVSHVTCTTGLLFPVREIAEFCRSKNIWFHIDGAQSVGMFPVNFNEIGCDSYAFSGHKWLGGPHETGVFYIRHSRLEEVACISAGSYTGELPRLPGQIVYADATSRHEYGTRNIGLISGLAEAVRLQEQIGRDRIFAHGSAMATHLCTELAKIPGIEVLTPARADMRGAITSIRHPRAEASKLFNYLMTDHSLRCRPVTEQNLQAVRISTHVFNSPAECERVIAGVRASVSAL